MLRYWSSLRYSFGLTRLLIFRRRPAPRGSASFGAWDSILSGIAYLAVAVNAALLCFTSTRLPYVLGVDTEGGKLALLLLLEHGFLALKLLLDAAVPDVSM